MRQFALLLLFVVVGSLWAQDARAVYTKASPSVLYLRHEFYLDPAKVANLALWKRLEDRAGAKILSNYLAIASGTGFFIDDRGHAITNRHVVEVGDVAALRKSALNSFTSGIDGLPTSQFSNLDKDKLKKDAKAVFGDGAYRFGAMAGTTWLGTVSVLAVGRDKEPDLALLEIAGAQGVPLPLLAAQDLGASLVGADVFSLGYPLGEGLDAMFKERVVTMNRGSISAYRGTEKLDVQHSAAISRGNSGGPLLDTEGRVVGVNTAALDSNTANSLFYAIGAKAVRSFLDAKGFGTFLVWSDRLAAAARGAPTTKVTVTSEPAGATVLAEGRLLGTTPFDLPLVAGKYQLSFQREGTAYPESEVVVETQAALRVEAKGRPSFAVHLTPGLPSKGVALEFTSSDGVFRFQSADAISLPEGAYQLKVNGVPGLAGSEIAVAVSGPSEVDLAPYFAHSSLTIRGLLEGATVWIDGVEQPSGVINPFDLSVGKHSVKASKAGYTSLMPLGITVRNDGKSFVTWKPTTSPTVFRDYSWWATLGTLTVGGSAWALGVVIGGNNIAVASTSTYAEYLKWKETTNTVASSGFSLVLTSVVLAATTWFFDSEVNRQQKEFSK